MPPVEWRVESGLKPSPDAVAFMEEREPPSQNIARRAVWPSNIRPIIRGDQRGRCRSFSMRGSVFKDGTRRTGHLTPVPAARRLRELDLSNAQRTCAALCTILKNGDPHARCFQRKGERREGRVGTGLRANAQDNSAAARQIASHRRTPCANG